MTEAMIISWTLFMIVVIFVPIVMIKRGIYMTGRDLFFTFLGMVIMSGFSLISLFY